MTAKLKTQLETARAALADALAASTAGNKTLAKLEQDRASIVHRLELLEAATERAPDDENAVARLATLREQQRLFDKKIAKLETGQLHDETPRRALEAAQQAAADLLIQTTRPELDALLREAKIAFTPFYTDPTRLQLAVERNDRILSLKAYLTNGGVGMASEKPQRLILLLDRLIAGGDSGWTWRPAPGAA